MYLFLNLFFSITITKENISFLNNNTNSPIFLKLWATWCPHCKKLEPIWEELALIEEFKNKIIFADIECEKNRKECHKFTQLGYPRLYWIDPFDKSQIEYSGSTNLENLISFIKKQLSFPLILLNSSEIQHQIEKNLKSSIFVFKISKKQNYLLSIIKEVAYKVRNVDCQFFLIDDDNNEDETSLNFYSNNNFTFKFNKNWNFKEIYDFIILNSFPFLNKIDGNIFKYFELLNKKIFLIVYNNSINLNDIIPFSINASSLFPVFKLNCNETNWFCNFISINFEKKSFFKIIYSKKEKLFWKFNYKYDFNKWLSLINENKIKGEGPGTGLIGFFKQPFYDAKIQNRKPPYLMFFPLLILSFGSILFIYLNKEENNKKID